MIDSLSISDRFTVQIFSWVNMEEDPFVVDAEILDHVSDPLPLPLDSPTRTPVSDSIVSESPQFSLKNSSDFTSPVWNAVSAT